MMMKGIKRQLMQENNQLIIRQNECLQNAVGIDCKKTIFMIRL